MQSRRKNTFTKKEKKKTSYFSSWTEVLHEVYVNVKQAFGIEMFKTKQKITNSRLTYQK